MNSNKIVFFFGLLLMSCLINAADFTVEALFPGKAMIKIEGKRIVLKAGEQKKGLTLISTDTYKQTALIEIDGTQGTYELGRHIGGGYAQAKTKEVLVNADDQGSFFVNGQINGRSVRFLLDTGASSVAMNENMALSLGLKYVDNNKRIMVATAGGNQKGYRVLLKEVSVGGISLNNVEGVVIEGSSPAVTLLGMTFLGQLELEHKQNLMVLRKKF
jgi:aspartyl protease family protein